MVDSFPNDHDYTFEAMTQNLNGIELSMRDGSVKQCRPVNLRMRGELNLVHRHFGDDSYKICKCSPEKHLPVITLFAIDGVNLSENPEQRKYMEGVRDRALTYSRRLSEGQLTDAEAIQMSKWAEKTSATLRKNPNVYNKCGRSPDEYLLDLSGLASEGIGFTNDQKEKAFMIRVRDKAQHYQKLYASGKLNDKQVEEIREWSREMRRRLTGGYWTGALPKTARKDDVPVPYRREPQPPMPRDNGDADCPTCTVIPDKYKRKSTGISDVRLVKVAPRQESDIRWVEKGY